MSLFHIAHCGDVSQFLGLYFLCCSVGDVGGVGTTITENCYMFIASVDHDLVYGVQGLTSHLGKYVFLSVWKPPLSVFLRPFRLGFCNRITTGDAS